MSPKVSWSQWRRTATNFLDHFKRDGKKGPGDDICYQAGTELLGWDVKIYRLNSLRSVRGLGGLTYHSEFHCQGVRFFASQMF